MHKTLRKTFLTWVGMYAWVFPVCAQGTFVNLDFEDPVLPLMPDLVFRVPIERALPGWTGYIGGSAASHVVYNTVSLGAPAISFLGPGSPALPFHGSYSVSLQPSQFGAPYVSAAIGQVGQVPSSARSLIFYGSQAGQFEVSFSGQVIPVADFGNAGTRYRMYGADISPYAGTIGELRFTALVPAQLQLDHIQFSSTPVPEPGTWALFGLGGALLCGARWRRGK